MYLRLLIISSFILLLGCSSTGPERNESSDSIHLTVWPESFVDGGKAAGFTTQVIEGADVSAEVSVQGAYGLKAVYFELAYDPAQLTPVSVEPTALLGSAEQTVALSNADTPGIVHCGQVLAHYAERAGFSGSGTVAVVHFARSPFAERTVSLAPATPQSKAVLAFDEGTSTLHWGYAHQGDYDQNSVTSIADLTPMAGRLGKAGPFDYATADSVVDGDSNGEINIADLTPIGANYGRHVEKYRVFAGLPADLPATNSAPSTIAPLDEVPHASATGSSTKDRLQFSYVVASPDPGKVYWVRPADGTSEGTPSNTLTIAVNNPPVITSVTALPNPVAPNGTSQITVDATDPDGDPLTYQWSTQTGNITGTDATVTYTPDISAGDGVYTVNITVHDNKGGYDTSSVEVTVETPEHVEFIVLKPSETLGGAGTAADPYIVTVDNTEIDLQAVSSAANDWTGIVAWQEDSSEPGTGFSQGTSGRLVVSPFDGSFSATAQKDTYASNTLYFRVEPPN